MPYGSILADTLQSSISGTPPQFNDGNGTQVGTLCRAWVNFNGTTSPGTIRASFNVTSVTKNGTGDYTVNFVNAMPDTNFTANLNKQNATSNTNCWITDLIAGRTTSAIRINSIEANALTDSTNVNVVIFR